MNSLETEGFDIINLDKLTLSEIVLLNHLLHNESMSGDGRNAQIKLILDRAGDR